MDSSHLCTSHTKIHLPTGSSSKNAEDARQAGDKLLVQHHILTPRINQLHDPISRLLPPEVVSQIFELCLSPIPATIHDSYVPPNFLPLLFGGVSQTWRRIAWSTPQLWTFLPINLNCKLFNCLMYPVGYEMTKDWLGRTGCLPLSIRVSRHGPSPYGDRPLIIERLYKIINLINEYSPRWQHLDLWLPRMLLGKIKQQPPIGSRPALETIRVYITDECTTGYFTMRMRHLSPKEINIKDIRYESLGIKWTNLTTLVADRLYSDEPLKIIASAPGLTSCTLLNVRHRENPPMPSAHPHIHHLLLDLAFSSEVLEASDFFCHVTLPALTCMKIEFPHEDDTLITLRITEFLHLSSPQLTTLSLNMPEISLAIISDMLRQLPSLTGLVLSRPFEPGIWTQLFKSIGQASDSSEDIFLPNLRHLTFEHPNDAAPCFGGWDLILETLQAALIDCDTDFCRNVRSLTTLYTAKPEPAVDLKNVQLKVKHVVGLVDLILAGIPLQIALAPDPKTIKYLDLIGLRDEIDVTNQNRVHGIAW